MAFAVNQENIIINHVEGITRRISAGEPTHLKPQTLFASSFNQRPVAYLSLVVHKELMKMLKHGVSAGTNKEGEIRCRIVARCNVHTVMDTESWFPWGWYCIHHIINGLR